MTVDSSGQVSVRGESSATTTNLQQGLVKMWIRLDGTGRETDASGSGSQHRDGERQLCRRPLCRRLNPAFLAKNRMLRIGHAPVGVNYQCVGIDPYHQTFAGREFRFDPAQPREIGEYRRTLAKFFA